VTISQNFDRPPPVTLIKRDLEVEPWITKQQVSRGESRKLVHSLHQVANFVNFSKSSLKQDLALNTLSTMRLEVKTSYETLHLLLDREVLLRCQIDQVLEEEENYVPGSKGLTKNHECEGVTHPVTRTFQDYRFRTCNKLCRLKKEARVELLHIEEVLGDLNVKQKQQVTSIESLESRLCQELAGFETTDAQEAELESARNEVLQFLFSLRDNFNRRAA